MSISRKWRLLAAWHSCDDDFGVFPMTSCADRMMGTVFCRVTTSPGGEIPNCPLVPFFVFLRGRLSGATLAVSPRSKMGLWRRRVVFFGCPVTRKRAKGATQKGHAHLSPERRLGCRRQVKKLAATRPARRGRGCLVCCLEPFPTCHELQVWVVTGVRFWGTNCPSQVPIFDPCI